MMSITERAATGTVPQCAAFVHFHTGERRDVIARMPNDLQRVIVAGMVHAVANATVRLVDACFDGLATREAFHALLLPVIDIQRELRRFLDTMSPSLDAELRTVLAMLQDARMRMCGVHGKIGALLASPAHAVAMRGTCIIPLYTQEQLRRVHANFFGIVHE